MTDAEETLVGFVTARYDKLKKELNPETDSNEAVNAVILLIDALFKTFKKSDSNHAAIVEKLVELQVAYNKLNLNPGEYPHNKNALAGLNAIVDELKEKEKEEE